MNRQQMLAAAAAPASVDDLLSAQLQDLIGQYRPASPTRKSVTTDQ
ncbi:hypothetical protein [Actinoplanes rectilineatus]|nr:hypothetical protein [Actinoplanes rectilineatus]